jgi:hypothetical protein
MNPMAAHKPAGTGRTTIFVDNVETEAVEIPDKGTLSAALTGTSDVPSTSAAA